MAYRRTHSISRSGGMFFLLDRLKIDIEVVLSLFRCVWKRLGQHHGSGTASQEGESFAIHDTILREEGGFL
jgi:hypothetical protein